MRCVTKGIVICVGLIVSAIAASAETAATIEELQPRVCTGGYHGKWGRYRFSKAKDGILACQEGYAVYAVMQPVGNPAEAKHVHVMGNCCPLPVKDILLDDHQIVEEQCPEGYVVTGLSDHHRCDTCIGKLRCSKINGTRYRLGPVTAGTYFSTAPLDYPWKEDKALRMNQVPVAIRYGVMRHNRYKWYHAGCVGAPIGSLLVGKHSKRCKGLSFRQLFFAKHAKDSSNTAVPMFPVCDRLSSKYSEDPQCVKTE